MRKKELFVKLVSGRDVCEVESQALITATDSKGVWCGKVDRAIRDRVGNYFHQSLFGHISQKTGGSIFEDGQTIEIFGNKSALKIGFDNVIFIIDDCIEPLSTIIEQGLEKANKGGYETVSMSAIRTGESFGKKEKRFEDMAKEISKGIHNFFRDKDTFSIEKLLLLTYDKEDYRQLLIDEFSKVDDITVIL